MNKSSNYQDVLKTTAIVIMVLDHLGLYFYPEILSIRVIGRYAFPVFCFFAGYNFNYKIKVSILLWGLALYIFSVTLIWQNFVSLNILMSIFLGQIYLYVFMRYKKNFYYSYAHLIFVSSLWGLTCNIFEYGSLTIGIMIAGYIVKHDKQKIYWMAFVTSILSFMHSSTIYYKYFSTADFILLLIVDIIVFLSLIFYNFRTTNHFKLNVFSRNTAFIYCSHLIIIMLIWKYGIF